MRTYAGPMLASLVSVNPCEPCFVDLVDHVLLMSSIPYDTSPTFIGFHMLQEE